MRMKKMRLSLLVEIGMNKICKTSAWEAMMELTQMMMRKKRLMLIIMNTTMITITSMDQAAVMITLVVLTKRLLLMILMLMLRTQMPQLLVLTPMTHNEKQD